MVLDPWIIEEIRRRDEERRRKEEGVPLELPLDRPPDKPPQTEEGDTGRGVTIIEPNDDEDDGVTRIDIGGGSDDTADGKGDRSGSVRTYPMFLA